MGSIAAVRAQAWATTSLGGTGWQTATSVSSGISAGAGYLAVGLKTLSVSGISQIGTVPIRQILPTYFGLGSAGAGGGGAAANNPAIRQSLGAAASNMTPGGRMLTIHAEEAILRHGFRDLSQIDRIIDSARWTATQADGAVVHIERVPGRARLYNMVVEGTQGIVTAMKEKTGAELAAMAKNHGWRLPF